MRKFKNALGEVWVLIKENAKIINLRGCVMQDPSGNHLFVSRKQLATHFKEI